MARHTATLTVHQLNKEDVYRDRVRIPTIYRGTISEGIVCKLSVAGKSLLVEVRAMTDNELAHEAAI